MINKIGKLIKTVAVNRTIRVVDYSTWIFSSSFCTQFNYNSKYLFEHVLKNEPDITPIFIINDDELRIKLKKIYGDKYFIDNKSNKNIRKVLNSGVWITSAGMPVYGFGLEKKRIIINLWHGVPLKRIALMENNLNPFIKIYFKYIFSNNYTCVVTTSNNLIPIMQESFGIEKEKIKVWGQPRNDTIFSSHNREAILNSLYGMLPIYKKIILYAPTYRDSDETNFFPFDDFDIVDLEKFLEEEELIIFIRCHQSETKNIKDNIGNRIILINSDKVSEIMDIINIFDLLITDYSSIYIDYLLTKKPVLFLPYDISEYIRNRGLNFDYDSVTPGPKPTTLNNFKYELSRLLKEEEYYSVERESINTFFNEVKEECSFNICNEIKMLIKEK